MTWAQPGLARISDSGGRLCTCAAQPKAHPPSYRAEVTDAATGEVRTSYVCTARAASFAAKRGIAFPVVKP
jgi:hypothetical protein